MTEYVGRLLVSIREASQVLSIGRTKLYELIAEGAIETVRVGNRRLVSMTELRRFAASLGVDERLETER